MHWTPTTYLERLGLRRGGEGEAVDVGDAHGPHLQDHVLQGEAVWSFGVCVFFFLIIWGWGGGDHGVKFGLGCAYGGNGGIFALNLGWGVRMYSGPHPISPPSHPLINILAPPSSSHPPITIYTITSPLFLAPEHLRGREPLEALREDGGAVQPVAVPGPCLGCVFGLWGGEGRTMSWRCFVARRRRLHTITRAHTNIHDRIKSLPPTPPFPPFPPHPCAPPAPRAGPPRPARPTAPHSG